MAISDITAKILWARAGGHCCSPDCSTDLIQILETGKYHIGEMAHVIARSENGPRGISSGGSDEYANLILLCPSCHTHIDKSPENTYSVELLLSWKEQAESRVRNAILRAKPSFYHLHELYFDILCVKWYLREFAFNPNVVWIYGARAEDSTFNILISADRHALLLGLTPEKIITNLATLIDNYRSRNWEYLLEEVDGLINYCEAYFNSDLEKRVINVTFSITELSMRQAKGCRYVTELVNFKSAINRLIGYDDFLINTLISNIQSNPRYTSGKKFDFDEMKKDPNGQHIVDLFRRVQHLIRQV